MDALAKWIGYGVALSTPFVFGLWVQSFDTRHQLLSQKVDSNTAAAAVTHSSISSMIEDNSGMIEDNKAIIEKFGKDLTRVKYIQLRENAREGVSM